MVLVPVEVKALDHPGQHLGGHRVRLARRHRGVTVQRLQQHHELVATDARHGVVDAHAMQLGDAAVLA